MSGARVIEVFADVLCPFTHVGLNRLVERRAELGRDDVVLRVRAWPLEIVNGAPLEAAFIAEEVEEIREQMPISVFTGFREDAFPGSALGALALSNAAYRRSLEVGEVVALELRRLVFEAGVNIGEPSVLDEVGARFGVVADEQDRAAVLADLEEGRGRGVIGSPHFFTTDDSFFCPSLEISRDDEGHLRVAFDPAGFDRFVAAAFG